MTVSTFRTVTAAALVLSLAVAGAAFQPAGTPASKPPQPQPKQPESGQPTREPGEKRGLEARRGEGMSVGASMKLMDRSLQQLREQVGDPTKKDDSLRLINEMQRGAVNAKGLPLPPDVLKHAADEATKIKLTVGFRRDLIALVRKLLDIETEIAEGKTDAAKTHLDEVIKMGESAHKELAGEHE